MNSLSKKAVKDIKNVFEKLFNKLKYKLLGPQSVAQKIYKKFEWHFSIPGIFESASRIEGVSPSEETLATVTEIASEYIDSYKSRAVARVVNEIEASLNEARITEKKTDIQTLVGNKVNEIMSDISSSVEIIVESEAQKAKNIATFDGITKMSAYLGDEDPVVCFITSKDEKVCEECIRIHCLEDGITPRVWKTSEIKHSYHKKGDEYPSIMGLHVNCRCQIVPVRPGFGFVNGFVTHLGNDHDELKKQRS